MDLKKALYYIPGIGLANHIIKEYKTRKGKNPWYNIKEFNDRKALGVYAIEVGYLVFAISWKVYVGKGIGTGDWHPFRFNSRNKIEKNIEKKNNLEKTINYEELLK